MKIRWLLIIAMILSFLAGCGSEPEGLTQEKVDVFCKIFNKEYTAESFTNRTEELLTKERQDKFEAVKEIYETEDGNFAFIVKPVAYNGPIDLAVGVEGKSHTTAGMRIIKHMETDHYVRDFEDDWFVGRFAGKKVDTYLEAVHLEQQKENEVVIITGATVTTQGVVNGVNAVMGIYTEAILGRSAEAVEYMVKEIGEPEKEEGFKETGTLKIRAEGRILGEIGLDEIMDMPSVERKMSVRSSQGETIHQFKGTLLFNILDAIDPALKDTYEWVEAIGVDDYISDLSMEEVRMENGVYLMYEDKGEPLETKEGDPGAMRVVVLDDTYGQRFTNYMIELILKK